MARFHLATSLGAFLFGAAGGILGCSASGGTHQPYNDTTPTPPDETEPPDGHSGETQTSDDGSPAQCSQSSECEDGVCAKPHNTGQTTPPPADQAICICVVEQGCCLPSRFTSFWCVDDDGCCTGRCDVGSGFCVDDDGTSDDDTSSDSTGVDDLSAPDPQAGRP